MNANTSKGFTLIELLILISIIALIARYFWANELGKFEDRFLLYLGFEPWVKSLVTVPLGCLIVGLTYWEESTKWSAKGKRAVRPTVLVFAAMSLMGIAGYLYYLSISAPA